MKALQLLWWTGCNQPLRRKVTLTLTYLLGEKGNGKGDEMLVNKFSSVLPYTAPQYVDIQAQMLPLFPSASTATAPEETA